MSELDRFVEFLRSAAAGYNRPPATPRDEIWAEIEASVFAGSAKAAGGAGALRGAEQAGNVGEVSPDPFVEFLRRTAAEYNAPPPTPRDEMWRSIEATLEGAGDESEWDAPDPSLAGAGAVELSDDPLSTAAAEYHAPPSTPREEMWRRIESAWQMRRSAAPEAQEAGLGALPPSPIPELEEPEPARSDRRRSATPWITGIAIAASLVIGIAIGQRSVDRLGRDPSGATVAQGDAPDAVNAGDASTGELARAQDPPGEEPATGRENADVDSERLETTPAPATRLAAIPVEAGSREPRESGQPGESGAGDPAAASTLGTPTGRRDAVLRYATTEHFEQAEALLTSFQTAGEQDDDDVELQTWARDLLAETRLLLDMPGERDSRNTELLQELELVLAQIAGLGSDAPAGERALVAEGLEREGTLPRLRAVMPTGHAANMRVGT
jgi:hypothetical protein